jgi:mono/diheme cytochrome c family protein
MKKFFKYFVIIVIVAIVGMLSYVKLALPNVGDAPEMKVEMTPENIARGEYLANHIAVCIDCHSTRDWSKFSGPPLEGTFGKGGELFDQKYGFPGSYTSKNITPAGISNWTDGELFRTITAGVNKDGKAMFPVMPFHYYGQMDEEDIKCIIAYIRTLKPIENKTAECVSDFPMNFIINTIPHKPNFQKRPPASDILATGKYIANASACIECHTKFEKGRLIAGTEFGGGREFPFPDGSIVRSGNITSDMETGIGSWSKDRFISLFHSRSDSSTIHTTLKKGDFNTIMPWVMYGKMTDADLEALYTYLRTVKPIKNSVEKYTPAN